MKTHLTFLLLITGLSVLYGGDTFQLAPVEGEPPVKVLIMAGQSNFGWGIRVTGMRQYAPEVLAWLESSENDALYSWKKHETGQGSRSGGFVRLGAAEGMYGPEHIIAYHLSRAWKEQEPKQRIAIVKVQKGATSLIQHWNPGGRKHWGTHVYPEGALHATLMAEIEAGIRQLDEAGIPWEGAGFFWYQGEGDAYDAGAKYARLFEDLVYGAELQTEQGVHQVKGVLPLIRNVDAPVIPVRISWRLHTVTRAGAPPPGMWGTKPREEWEPHLVQVREALTRFAREHNGRETAIVEIDDLPLSDRFHYGEREYIEIGHRMAAAYAGGERK